MYLKMRLYNKTFFLILIYDIFSIGICWFLAFLLRFNFDIPTAFLISIKKSLVFVVLLQLIIFYVLDIYKIVWKYINLDDLIRIVISIILSSTLLGFFSLIVSDYLIIPRSVLFIYPSIFLILTLGSRLIQRIFFEQVNLNFDEMSSEMSRPIILLGLDDNSVHLIKMLKKNKNFKLIGILDNNSKIHNLKISGIPILGSFDSLIDIANKFDIKHAILAKSDLNDRESISIINAGKRAELRFPKFLI